ncbi:MAG: hypothetical protein ACPGC9_00015 [Cytophagales bacterium]
MNNKTPKNLEIHEGKIVQRLIKESPQTLTGIAQQMGKSRNVIYSRFKMKRLAPSFLFSLGKIINIDFTSIFPRLADDKHYLGLVDEKESVRKTQKDDNYKKLQEQYYSLLERYNKLLKFLIQVIQEHGLKSIEKELQAFLDSETEL